MPWMSALLISLSLTTTPVVRQAPRPPEQDVLDAQKRYLEAYSRCDARLFKELTTEDNTVIISSGQMLTNQQYLDRCIPKNAPGTRKEQRVRFLREDVAIITGILQVRMADGALTEPRRFTEVWTKQQGNWKRAALQATSIMK